MNKKKVSLVLGSGGARGLAHIGVIRWLEEHNYTIASISGCSIGSLVGGIYAAGKLDEFEQWVCAINRLDIVGLLDLSWHKSGLVKGDKIINTLTELVGDMHIESLDIPFTAVAVDIKRVKEVWMSSGSLFDAIRASISLPLFFTPYEYQDALLVDGGVLNPVPIAPTFGDLTDLTVAVNLGGSSEISPYAVQHQLLPAQDVLADGSGDSASDVLLQGLKLPDSLAPVHDKITQFIARLQPESQKNAQDDWGMYDVIHQSFDAMQSAIARQQLAVYPPDIVIEVPRNSCSTLEFDRAAEMIELGYRRAGESLQG